MSSDRVMLTKMCELHGIDMPREGKLADTFRTTFPAASYDDEAGEWRMVWKKGSFAESNARLEEFFTSNGVKVEHIDKC